MTHAHSTHEEAPGAGRGLVVPAPSGAADTAGAVPLVRVHARTLGPVVEAAAATCATAFTDRRGMAADGLPEFHGHTVTVAHHADSTHQAGTDPPPPQFPHRWSVCTVDALPSLSTWTLSTYTKPIPPQAGHWIVSAMFLSFNEEAPAGSGGRYRNFEVRPRSPWRTPRTPARRRVRTPGRGRQGPPCRP